LRQDATSRFTRLEKLDNDLAKDRADKVPHERNETWPIPPGQFFGIVPEIIGKTLSLELEKFLRLTCVIPI